MFKRGTVVQHKVNPWIGVILTAADATLPSHYVAIKWFAGRDGGGHVLAGDVSPIGGYEFEAALALGDTAKVLEMYRAAQAAERERDEVRASYNAIHEIVWGEWFRSFPEYAFDGGQLAYHIKHLVDGLRADLDAANTRTEAVEHERDAAIAQLPPVIPAGTPTPAKWEINGKVYETDDIYAPGFQWRVSDATAQPADGSAAE